MAFSTPQVFSGQVIKDWPLSLDMYAAYRENARSFEEFGVWTPGAAAVNGVDDPEQVATVAMTHGVLRALGVRPYLGRWFSSADDIPGAQKTVILSYKYWQRRFGGDGRVLGRLVLIDFVPYQVIGVMPRSFEFLNLAPDVFLAQSRCQRRAGISRRRSVRRRQAQARYQPCTSQSRHSARIEYLGNRATASGGKHLTSFESNPTSIR